MADKYYSIHKFAKILGVTPQTLRNCDMIKELIEEGKQNDKNIQSDAPSE